MGEGEKCVYDWWWGKDFCEPKKEEEVGFSNYKCAARNNCIYECQMDDEDKSWYSCMKECPKKLCEKDDTSDSVDPEDSDSEEQVAGGCYTESGSCKSGYYKLSGGLKCCPRLSEISVGDELCTCTGRYTGWVAGGEACQFGNNCAPRSRCS